MKTLYLIRHAKSSWSDAGLPDRERPLNDRGQRDATTMGARLGKRVGKPDLIISSPAMRAVATAEAIARSLDYRRKDIVVDDRLYAGTAQTLLEVIGALGDGLKHVVLVGHNPELTELAHRFSGAITDMPTCAIASFTFDARKWSGIGQAKPVSTGFDAPKSLSE